MESLVPVLFLAALFVNARAVVKLLLDWKGMATTIDFVRRAYGRLDALPTEERLERCPAAPVFLHLLPAYQEPNIAETVRALVTSRYAHAGLHVVVVTKEEEEHAPHPGMATTTGELVRQLRETLPPYQQKRLSHLVMPGPGRKAHQLNWALRPQALRDILGAEVSPDRVFVGVSDADSIPDPDTYRWVAHRELTGPGAQAYQGITLSLANYDGLGIRGKICAIQQSSIFIRVSIARLINEVKRVRAFARLAARAPGVARLLRPAFDFCLRRSQICLGHNQFVRLDLLQAVGGFPTSGATEDSTLGYLIGARGVLIEAMPMVELTDLPETSEKVIRQNARWYLGVLDDVPVLGRLWRLAPTPFNLAQLLRHVGNKVVEWPVAAVIYPFTGWLGWYLAYTYRDVYPGLFYLGVGAPTLSLLLTVWVGGIVTQTMIEELAPYLPRPVELRRKSLKEKFLGTFRCQTYWLLATRASWRVLWSLWRTGSYEAAKTDRVGARRSRALGAPVPVAGGSGPMISCGPAVPRDPGPGLPRDPAVPGGPAVPRDPGPAIFGGPAIASSPRPASRPGAASRPAVASSGGRVPSGGPVSSDGRLRLGSERLGGTRLVSPADSGPRVAGQRAGSMPPTAASRVIRRSSSR
jgi:cellulose synthase/poly-beta-1,6-N-acetylglucosamine synthase-like glycosyltransferase